MTPTQTQPKPACMTDGEYAAWSAINDGLAAVRQAAPRPCSDCTIAFYVAQHRAGTCDGFPRAREPRSLNRAWTDRNRRRARIAWAGAA